MAFPVPLSGLRLRSPIVMVLLVSALVCAGVIGLRQWQWLEALELAAYDWCLNHQSVTSTVTSPLVIIMVSEDDLRRQGRWPLSDGTVAQALRILEQHRPRVIGLDIFRDMPIPPGTQTLADILKSNTNIIGVTYMGGRGQSPVPPPQVLEGTSQIGFADVPVDRDGILRRGLLFLDDGDITLPSFPLQVALWYLRAEGISPQPGYSDPQHLRLGEVTIPPFERNDGGYVAADAKGYQFLLDFQGATTTFPRFSLTSLLAGEIPSEAIRDRIVLMGVTAESVKDFFLIPYGNASQLDYRLPGVVLHAYVVDQLVRFASRGATPLVVSGETQEWGWIGLWCLLGGIFAARRYSPWLFLCGVGGGLVLLGAVVYAAFLYQWWIPLVPAALGWLLSATVVRILLAPWQTEAI